MILYFFHGMMNAQLFSPNNESTIYYLSLSVLEFVNIHDATYVYHFPDRVASRGGKSEYDMKTIQKLRVSV